MNKINMSFKEREQAKVFTLVEEKAITQQEAARRLNITERWVKEKMNRFTAMKEAGLVHLSRGEQSNKRWCDEEKNILINHLNSDWIGFGPTFASEKLSEIYAINRCKETVRTVMIQSNVWKPKKQKIKYKQRRERRPMLGMLVQVDGSPHDWFEGRNEKCTLLVFIDDATSQILWLEFAPSESNESLMMATKNYIEKQGVPQSFYTDHGSVFHVNLNNPDNNKKTQWEQACMNLNIEIIHANSPQAKGRVERCNQTMQDRLVKEMRLQGISSIEAANTFLQKSNFIQNHNQKFAVIPAEAGNAHRSSDIYNLDLIFAIKEQRKIAQDLTLLYKNCILQLHKEQRTIIKPKDIVTILTKLNGEIQLWIRKTRLFYYEIKPRKIVNNAYLLDPFIRSIDSSMEQHVLFKKTCNVL